MYNFIFKTKLVNDELFKRNGEKVRILRSMKDFFEIEFETDKIKATVYKSEGHGE